MQATLVAFYGPKLSSLVKVLGRIQEVLAGHPGLRFTPYEEDQVHATIAGLEGLRVGDHLVSANFTELRRKVKLLRLGDLAQYLQSSRHLPFTVRIGGFERARNYSFASRGLHPQARSFSIQGRIAVAMGWPIRDGVFPPTLDLLRRELASFGALHKYHASEGEVDNDFFFVLGQVDRRGLDGSMKRAAEEEVRDYLSKEAPVDVTCEVDALSFVAYSDTTLPPSHTQKFSVADIAARPDSLVKLYKAAD